MKKGKDMQIPRLLQHFENGEYHIAHKYWTGNALADCMLAEQHIIMYEDEETGDVLGFSYVYDLIEQYRKEKEIKKELEKNYKELGSMSKTRTLLQINSD